MCVIALRSTLYRSTSPIFLGQEIHKSLYCVDRSLYSRVQLRARCRAEMLFTQATRHVSSDAQKPLVWLPVSPGDLAASTPQKVSHDPARIPMRPCFPAAVADNVHYSLGEYWLLHTEGVTRGYDAMYGGPPYGPSLKNWLQYSVSFNLDKIRSPILIEVMGKAFPMIRRTRSLIILL